MNNSYVVIDETHNLVSRIIGGGVYGPLLYYMICTCQNSKVVALSGTPIINSPFENYLRLNVNYTLYSVLTAKS